MTKTKAATLNVIGGQLHWAFGVDVGETLYDVEFLDGSCITLFNGRDSLDGSAFSNATDATLASNCPRYRGKSNLILGRLGQSAIATLVERQTCNVILLDAGRDKTSSHICSLIAKKIKTLPNTNLCP